MYITWRSDMYGWEQLPEAPFKIKEYIALNGSIQLIPFDEQTIKENPPSVAKNLSGLFDGYKIYQFNKISQYRQYPLRIVYSPEKGRLYEVKGENHPIYRLMGQLYAGFKDESALDNWIDQELYTYLLFFFDNVSGRHGRFELLDLRNHLKQVSALDQIIDRVNSYYTKNPSKREQVELDHEEQFLEKFKIAYSDVHTQLIKNALSLFFKNKYCSNPEQMHDGTDRILSRDNFMIFLSSLFLGDILFSKKEDDFGMVEMTNEKSYVIWFSTDIDGEIKVDIVPANIDSQGNSLSELPAGTVEFKEFPYFD